MIIFSSTCSQMCLPWNKITIIFCCHTKQLYGFRRLGTEHTNCMDDFYGAFLELKMQNYICVCVTQGFKQHMGE